MEQIFINLLIKARDAIEEKWERNDGKDHKNGTKKIFLKTAIEDGSVKIQVKDTIGIPETVLERIFDPFFTTKKVGKGTGFGLSVSYRIVRDYDGNIYVKSKLGEGSTFTISFRSSHVTPCRYCP